MKYAPDWRNRAGNWRGWIAQRSGWLIPTTLLLAGLFFALLFGTDYGISTDEPINYQVGRDALKALARPVGYLDYMRHGEALGHHGPSYFMVYAGGAKLLTELLPTLHLADGRHLVNFLTFLLGVGAFYTLATRLMAPRYAGLATAFFATQPLLLGHGFINQKDMPFMVFFLVSVVAGLRAADGQFRESPRDAPRGVSALAAIRMDWSRAKRGWRIVAVAALLLILLLGLEIFVLRSGLDWAEGIVARAYAGEAWGPLNNLFAAAAEDAGEAPVEAYLLKVAWGYWIGRFLAMSAVVAVGLTVGRHVLPTAFGSEQGGAWRPAALVLLAGALFGFTISIRPIAGFVGLLVSAYWLWHLRGHRSGLLLLYWLAAAAVTYITWPYLWDAPLERLAQSVLFSSEFNRPTEYFGTILYSDELPWHYVWAMASVQLTEWALPLALLGTAAAAGELRGGRNRTTILVLLFWLAVPVLGVMAFDVGIYGNIRHLLFVLVPMLLLAGLGLHWLLTRIRRTWLQALLLLIVFAPNVIAIVRLHPYEYSHFNRYVGGMPGASERFTLDRWCTSYRETMAFVNEVAEPSAVVAALQAPQAARPFARKDLTVSYEYERPPEEATYLLTCSWFLGGYLTRTDWERIHTVERAGAVLAEVYQKR